MTGRILLIDDEPHIRRLLIAYLEAEGFAVAEAGTGSEAMAVTRELGPGGVALALLDLGLPDVDGLDLLVRLRSLVPGLPVIVVTARTEEGDRIIGLTSGADDYVVKPFGPREVVARVHAVLRRTRIDTPPAPAPEPHASPERLVRGGLVVDLACREVSLDGRAVRLTALEFDILARLAASPGRVFTRAQLLEQVWGYEHLGDERVVDVHVRSIRRRLHDDASHPRLIGTVRGVGYKLLPAPLPEGDRP